MRHSPARRSLFTRFGTSVRLTDRRHNHQAHERSGAFPAPWSPRRMWRLAMAVGIAGAGFCLVLAMVVLVVALGGTTTGSPQRVTRTSTSPSDASGGHSPYRTTIVYEPRPVAGHGSASTVRYGLGLLVAQFHGAGSVQGRQFRITSPGDWGISWQFSCPEGHPGDLTVYAGHAATGNGRGDGFSHPLGHGNGKEPPGQAKKNKSHKVPPGQAKKHKAKKHKAGKHKKKTPLGQAKKAAKKNKHGTQPGAGHQNDRDHQDSRVTFSASGHHGRGMSWYDSDPGDHTLEVVSGCSWAIKIVLPKP